MWEKDKYMTLPDSNDREWHRGNSMLVPPLLCCCTSWLYDYNVWAITYEGKLASYIHTYHWRTGKKKLFCPSVKYEHFNYDVEGEADISITFQHSIQFVQGSISDQSATMVMCLQSISQCKPQLIVHSPHLMQMLNISK